MLVGSLPQVPSQYLHTSLETPRDAPIGYRERPNMRCNPEKFRALDESSFGSETWSLRSDFDPIVGTEGDPLDGLQVEDAVKLGRRLHVV
jgi:hypothetical protein